MREINNNTNNLNFQGVQKFDQHKEKQHSKPDVVNEDAAEKTETQDLSQMPAAITGRSLVSFKGNPVDTDVKFMMENPEIVSKANKFFDMAEQICGYENAAKLTDAFVKEFLN